MSKRHQASHEVRERNDRGQHTEGFEFELNEWGTAGQADPLGFLDPRSPRIRFALGD